MNYEFEIKINESGIEVYDSGTDNLCYVIDYDLLDTICRDVVSENDMLTDGYLKLTKIVLKRVEDAIGETSRTPITKDNCSDYWEYVHEVVDFFTGLYYLPCLEEELNDDSGYIVVERLKAIV